MLLDLSNNTIMTSPLTLQALSADRECSTHPRRPRAPKRAKKPKRTRPSKTKSPHRRAPPKQKTTRAALHIPIREIGPRKHTHTHTQKKAHSSVIDDRGSSHFAGPRWSPPYSSIYTKSARSFGGYGGECFYTHRGSAIPKAASWGMRQLHASGCGPQSRSPVGGQAAHKKCEIRTHKPQHFENFLLVFCGATIDHSHKLTKSGTGLIILS